MIFSLRPGHRLSAARAYLRIEEMAPCAHILSIGNWGTFMHTRVLRDFPGRRRRDTPCDKACGLCRGGAVRPETLVAHQANTLELTILAEGLSPVAPAYTAGCHDTRVKGGLTEVKPFEGSANSSGGSISVFNPTLRAPLNPGDGKCRTGRRCGPSCGTHVGPIEPSLALLAALQRRWMDAWRSLRGPDWSRTFLHPKGGAVSLEQLAGLYAWHGRHHVAQIRAALHATGT